MRFLLAVLLVLLPAQAQTKAEFRPKFQKFDKVAVACKVQTEVASSNGRNSKYDLELELSAEVEKSEGETAEFDCGVSVLRIKGTLDGKPVDYEWRKGGAERGAKIASIQKGLEKGWKVVLGKKGIAVNDAANEFCDALPLFNPGIFLGFSVPPPFDAVAVGKGWDLKNQSSPFFNGFSLRHVAELDLVKGDTAKVSAQLSYSKAESEVPIEGVVNVKGEGHASMDYDLKAGRPLKGATSLKLSATMGGLKRDVTQVIEFEVRR